VCVTHTVKLLTLPHYLLEPKKSSEKAQVNAGLGECTRVCAYVQDVHFLNNLTKSAVSSEILVFIEQDFFGFLSVSFGFVRFRSIPSGCLFRQAISERNRKKTEKQKGVIFSFCRID